MSAGNGSWPQVKITLRLQLAIRTTPPEYTTFKIIDVLRDSPASEAGVRPGDIITAIDGRPAKDLTMTILSEMLEKAVPYVMTLRRGDQEVEVRLTPKRMVAPTLHLTF